MWFSCAGLGFQKMNQLTHHRSQAHRCQTLTWHSLQPTHRRFPALRRKRAAQTTLTLLAPAWQPVAVVELVCSDWTNALVDTILLSILYYYTLVASFTRFLDAVGSCRCGQARIEHVSQLTRIVIDQP